MNNSELKNLYDKIELDFHQALSIEDHNEYTKIIINYIAKTIAIAPQLEGFRAFYKQESLNKIAKFKERQLEMLEKMKLLIEPLLLQEVKIIALKNINLQYEAIINSNQPLDWQIFEIEGLLRDYCTNLVKDMRFNLNQDHTQLLQSLVKTNFASGLIFFFDQDIIAYEQEQADFEKFMDASLYIDIGNIINLYQIKGMGSFTGKNSHTLHQVDCNKTIRRVLDALQKWMLSLDNSLLLRKNISYDWSTGYLVIMHNLIHHRIKFGKTSLRGKVLEFLFPGGNPRKETISFAEIYDEIKRQTDHTIWDEFSCKYFDDLDADNSNDGEDLIKPSQEKVKKSIRDSIDGNNAINDKIFKATGLKKVIFIDNLNIFVRCH